MRIKFAGPLAKVLGTKECLVTVQQGITLDEVIAILSGEFSHTGFFRDGIVREDFVPYVWMALKNGRDLLNPDDRLEDSDEIEFIPPIMGG